MEGKEGEGKRKTKREGIGRREERKKEGKGGRG